MVALKFDSIESLQKSAELSNAQQSALKRKKCNDVFSSFEKMLREARNKKTDVEHQLMLLYRCGELANIIMKDNGFPGFKDKLRFHADAQEVLSTIDKLKHILEDEYKKKQLNGAGISNVQPTTPSLPDTIPKSDGPPHVIPPSTIKARDLVRATTTRDIVKKTAVILDFRKDQKTESISFNNDNLITVISVPRDIIEHGLIFANLKSKLPVGSRTLLNRLTSCDIVVLMDNVTPPMSNGVPDNGTPAFILLQAIWEYNRLDRPKSKPLIMEGGFADWKLTYQTYVKRDTALKEPEDQMDDLIRNYRSTQLNISYPDLSPKRPAQASPVPRDRPSPPSPRESLPSNGHKYGEPRLETTFGIVDGTSSSTSLPSSSLDTQGPRASPSSSSISSISRGGTLIGTATPKPYPHVPPAEPVYARPGQPAPNDFSTLPASSGFHPSVNVPSHKDVPRLPNVDRGSKPHTNGLGSFGNSASDAISARDVKPSYSTVAAPPKSALTPSVPSLDRRTKPVLVGVTQETEGKLLEIYRSMSLNIENNGSKRNSSKPKPGCTGLYNMGNTCFMSASLQALFHTPQLIDLFTKENFIARVNTHNKLGTGGVISAVFSSLVDHIWSGEYSAIRPQRFLRLFADEVNSSLADGQQHDASEFQLFLLDALHEDTNQVRQRKSFEQNYKGGPNINGEARDFTEKSMLFSDSLVNRIFNLQSVSELQCRSCGEQSATFEDSRLISVELPHSSQRSTTLVQCLTSHFSDTQLEGDCRWNCPKCKSPQPSRRSTRVWQLPPILMIHLKRFSIVNGDYEKNPMPVDFDHNRLDMAPFLHRGAPRTVADTYRLYAVTNHRGRLNSGHYTAVASHARTGEWLRFDDESVIPTSATSIDTSDAYILYYKKHNI